MDASIHTMIQISHLDGHLFTLESKNVTYPQQMVAIENEGMPVFERVNISLFSCIETYSNRVEDEGSCWSLIMLNFLLA